MKQAVMKKAAMNSGLSVIYGERIAFANKGIAERFFDVALSFENNDILGNNEPLKDPLEDRIALCREIPAGDAVEHVTYRQLATRVRFLMDQLTQQGIYAGQRLGFLLADDQEKIELILAAMALGITFVPVSQQLPVERAQQVLRRANCDAFIYDQQLTLAVSLLSALATCEAPADTSETTPSEHSSIRLFENSALFCYQSHRFSDFATSPAVQGNLLKPKQFPTLDAIAYCLFTSGSTGEPKCIEITQAGILNTILATNHAHAITAQDRSILVTDIGFDAVLIQIFCPLLAGGSLLTLLPTTPKVPEEVWRAVCQYQVTFLDGSPLFLGLIAECCRSTDSKINDSTRSATPRSTTNATDSPAHQLRLIITGGDVLTPAVYQQLTHFGDVTIANHYGPTEVSIDATFKRVTSANNINIGQPIVNATCFIVDENLQLLPAGDKGELLVASPGLAKGYANNPQSTAKAFIDGTTIQHWPAALERPARLYRTGDLACIKHGEITLFGRNDRQIKIRGVRGDLNEVEAVLRAMPAVHDCRVVVEHAQNTGKVLVAYLATVKSTHDSPDAPLNLTGIKQALDAKLPKQMVPAAIKVVTELPLNKNGKIDEAALTAMASTTLTLYAPAVEKYDNPTQEIIAGICAELLAIEPPPKDVAFHAIGIHSLLLTRIANRVAAQLTIELTTQDLLKHSTITQLAAYCETATTNAPLEDTEALNEAAPFPLSPNQVALWLTQQMEPESTLYNLPLVIEFTGNLQVSRLQAALQQVWQRHPMLNAIFTEDQSHTDSLNVWQQCKQHASPTLTMTDLRTRTRAAVERDITTMIETPFALQGVPLVRMELLHVDEQAFTLVIVIHHLICDGWSIEVLYRDIIGRYQAQLADEQRHEMLTTKQHAQRPYQYFVAQHTSTLPVPFTDANKAKNNLTETSSAQELAKLTYWQKQLRDLNTLPFPTDYPRPPVKSSAGNVLRYQFSEQTSQQLRQLAAAQQASLFQVCYSIFAITLRHYAQTNDIVCGIASSGRSAAGYEHTLGMFVNTLVLKTPCYPQQSFSSVLNTTKTALTDALLHEVDFNTLLQAINPPRDASRTPIFQVMFDYHYEDIHDKCEVANGLWAQSPPRQTNSAKFDLAMDIYEAKQITVMLEYATTLFTESRMNAFLAHFNAVTTQCLAAPERPLFTLSFFQEYLPLNAQPTTTLPAQSPNVIAQFYHSVDRFADSIAVEDGRSQLTYQQLDRQSNALAAKLLQRGVAEESVVAIYLPRSIDYVVAVIATLKAGAAFMPLDPAQPSERLAIIAQTSCAQLLLSSQKPSLHSPECAAHTFGFSEEQRLFVEDHMQTLAGGNRDDSTRPTINIHPEQLAFVFYTSGSTGTPKGVMVPLKGLYNQLALKVNEFGITPEDGIGFIATPGFDVSIWQSLTALMAGARTVIYPDHIAWEPEALLQHTNTHQVAAIETVPSHFNSMLQYLEEHHVTLHSLRYLMLNGEALLAEHCDRWFALYPHIPIVNGYGATEVSDDCTHNVSFSDSAINRHKPMPVNGTLPGYQVYVLDEFLDAVPPGASGEICVGGLGVARGYFQEPIKTAAQFVPNPYALRSGSILYRTGDMASYDTQGNIYYLGRTDDQLKINGIRVELGEIETAVRALPNVEHSLTCLNSLALPNKELITFYIEPVNNAEHAAPLFTPDLMQLFTPDHMQQQLAEKLPVSVIPRHFVRLASFPMKANGKIDTGALFHADETQQALTTNRKTQPASTPQEQQVLKIWNEVLGVAHNNILMDFFETGGHSMSATVILGRIQREFGHRLSMKDFYLQPNVKHLSATLCALIADSNNTESANELSGFNEIDL